MNHQNNLIKGKYQVSAFLLVKNKLEGDVKTRRDLLVTIGQYTSEYTASINHRIMAKKYSTTIEIPWFILLISGALVCGSILIGPLSLFGSALMGTSVIALNAGESIYRKTKMRGTLPTELVHSHGGDSVKCLYSWPLGKICGDTNRIFKHNVHLSMDSMRAYNALGHLLPDRSDGERERHASASTVERTVTGYRAVNVILERIKNKMTEMPTHVYLRAIGCLNIDVRKRTQFDELLEHYQQTHQGRLKWGSDLTAMIKAETDDSEKPATSSLYKCMKQVKVNTERRDDWIKWLWSDNTVLYDLVLKVKAEFVGEYRQLNKNIGQIGLLHKDIISKLSGKYPIHYIPAGIDDQRARILIGALVLMTRLQAVYLNGAVVSFLPKTAELTNLVNLCISDCVYSAAHYVMFLQPENATTLEVNVNLFRTILLDPTFIVYFDDNMTDVVVDPTLCTGLSELHGIKTGTPNYAFASTGYKKSVKAKPISPQVNHEPVKHTIAKPEMINPAFGVGATDNELIKLIHNLIDKYNTHRSIIRRNDSSASLLSITNSERNDSSASLLAITNSEGDDSSASLLESTSREGDDSSASLLESTTALSDYLKTELDILTAIVNRLLVGKED